MKEDHIVRQRDREWHILCLMSGLIIRAGTGMSEEEKNKCNESENNMLMSKRVFEESVTPGR